MWSTSEPSQQTVADLIAEGRSALLAGERVRARALLQMAIRDDPENAEAWLWMSGTHTVPEDIAYCLQQVLRIEPDNAQALDGIEWLQEAHGVAPHVPETVAPPPPVLNIPQPEPAPESQSRTRPSRPIAPAPPRTSTTKAKVFTAAQPVKPLWAGTHIIAIGVLVGLLRLVLLLRPTELLLARSARGPIEPVAALGLTAITAVGHSLAFLLVWALLANMLNRARTDRATDHSSSAAQIGQVLLPGYGVAGALIVAASALSWSERRWTTALIAIALILLGCAVASIWRLNQLARTVQPQRKQPFRLTMQLLVPAVAVMAAGLFLAATVVRLLLTSL